MTAQMDYFNSSKMTAKHWFVIVYVYDYVTYLYHFVWEGLQGKLFAQDDIDGESGFQLATLWTTLWSNITKRRENVASY